MSDNPEKQLDQPIAKIEYELTEDVGARAALALFRLGLPKLRPSYKRVHLLLILVISIQLLAGLIVGVVWFWDSREMRILVAVGVVVQLILVLRASLYYLPSWTERLIRWRAARYVRGLPHRDIRWLLFEDRIETQSAVSSRTVPWSDLQRLRLLPEFWVLTLKPRQEVFLPASALSTPVQAWIEQKAKDVSATVERMKSDGL